MYYRGEETTQVKPIMTGRTTAIRRMSRHHENRNIKRGPVRARGPLNYRGYAHPGEPSSIANVQKAVALHQVQETVKAKDGASLSSPVDLDMSLSPGQSFLGQLNVLPSGFTGFTSTFTPSTAAPAAPASTSFWNPIASIVDLWNSRPQALKNIRIRVSPQKVAQQLQQTGIVKSGQVQQAVDYARSFGMDPTYLTPAGEIPITGAGVAGAYRAEGFDWQTYLPWILGGGAALIVIPVLMRRR